MVRPTAVVGLNSDWLNCFTRTRGSGLGHPAKLGLQRQHFTRTRGLVTETGNGRIKCGDDLCFWSAPISLIVFTKTINKMDNKIGFEMSLIVVEAIRGRYTSFMILTAMVSEIFGGQTNSPILVV